MNPNLAIEQDFPAIHSPTGFKRFFSREPLGTRQLRIRGIGIREWMPPCIVERPSGTGDYLLMLFHDAACVGRDKERLEKPDTLMIWPPGKSQSYGNPSQRFCHSWIHCQGSRIREILRRAGPPILKPFQISDTSRFQQCLLDTHSELVSYARPDAIMVGNFLENGVRSIARTLAHKGHQAQIPENLLAVRRLIGTAPKRNLTLSEMAALAGMSVPYFCSSFKKAFDLSPVECLIQHRMHHAAHLLTNKNLSITQIAEEVGYSDLFHFSKMFKKHFGLSPRELRKRKLE
jgi:AraC family transcriptional regulator of arabinose operon